MTIPLKTIATPTTHYGSRLAGTMSFIVQRTTSDARGPYEFTVSTMRGDRYEIRSKLRM